MWASHSQKLQLWLSKCSTPVGLRVREESSRLILVKRKLLGWGGAAKGTEQLKRSDHEAKVKWGPSVAERTDKRDVSMVC